MAYVADQDQQQSTVASSTPLDSGGGQAAAQPSQEGPTSAPTPTPVGTTSTEAASQGQTQSKAAPKASSGMFTNIQKYVQKNRPQAQKMSQAVTQDVGEQAAEIRGAAEQKQAQTQAQLDANKAAMTQARTGAEQAVAGIMGTPQPQAEGQPQAQPMQAQDFQSLMKGDIAGTTDVQDVNLAQQQMKSQALQGLAGRARTEQGRKDLLRGTFGDKGEYTRGMSGLDQLIVGGDKAARESMIGGIEQQAGDLQSQLRGIQQQTGQDIAAQRQSRGQFGEDIRAMAEDPASQMYGDVESKLAAEQAAREGMTPELQAMQEQYGRGEALKAAYKTLGQNFAYDVSPYLYDEYKKTAGVDPMSMEDFQNISMTADDLTMIGADRSKIGEAMGGTYSGPNVWGSANAASFDEIKRALAAYDPSLKRDEMQKSLADLGYSETGSDLSLASVATPEQIQKYNALQNLMGKQQIIAPEAKQDYASQEELQDILRRYSTSPAAGQVRTSK